MFDLLQRFFLFRLIQVSQSRAAQFATLPRLRCALGIKTLLSQLAQPTVFHTATTWIVGVCCLGTFLNNTRKMCDLPAEAAQAYWRFLTAWRIGRINHQITMLRAERRLAAEQNQYERKGTRSGHIDIRKGIA
jgi:hypothetical protein